MTTTQLNHDNNALNHCILQEIKKQNGALSFERFMSLALYHPLYGYYNQPELSFGQNGDFTTAPEISSLFGICFAQQIRPMLANLPKRAAILELGAGSGKFAHDLIEALKKTNALPPNYYIYEISPNLRKRQQHYLSASLPHYFSKIIWLSSLPRKFSGVIVGNELLDALPIHLFTIDNDGPKERAVAIHHGKLSWCTKNTDINLLKKAHGLQQKYNLPVGYTSEIHLNLKHMIKKLANLLTEGYMLFADYGYGEKEYYHPERQHGTLKCFYKHQSHDNPLQSPGLQDITAHVNFTEVIETGFENGCELMGHTTQASFLLSCGLMQEALKLEENLDEHEKLALHQAIKLLTFPTEMGERVKIMALKKNIDCEAIGFSTVDLRHEL